ncbi:MAG: hypothetical protein BroJett025_05840 [Patescibacteria group bacterium]|nr:MAG: hypothetical protein BroJett025_05840 [Patescibacteria group bacterium]
MIEEIKSHKIAYAVLAFVLIGFIVLFMHFWPDRAQQRILVICLGMFYFLWGVIVHKNMKHINSKVVFEYLAIAILAVSLLLLLLN